MKELFKDFREMGEEFRKMGQELAKGAADIAEGAASIFDGLDPLFKTTSYSYSYSKGDKAGTGTLTTEAEHFTLAVPVPGIAPSELDVRVFANKVRVSTVNSRNEKAKYDYELPEQIDPKLCLATLHRGVLTIKVQKTGIVSTGVKIEVKEN